jgi:serine/threonine-protein kinase RsbW
VIIMAMVMASFSAELTNLDAIRNFVSQAAKELEIPEADAGDMIQAVDEAATNIIVHGYRGEEGIIDLEAAHIDNRFRVKIGDRAPQFNPLLMSPPNLTLGLDQRRPGGLGIYMIRQLVDQVEYRTPAGGGNELTLIKRCIEKENKK